MMKTAIRMDDITADMDYIKFNKIRKILDDAGIRPLIGVVPFCEDETLRMERPHEDFNDMLVCLQDNGWTIALHGYNHLYTTRNKGIFPINNFSEFAGVGYERQNEMIRKGLNKLREWKLNPVIFMAPGHTFDKNTVKALKENGVFAITDGFGKLPYIKAGVTYYPISSRRSQCTSDRDGYSTYVLHTNTMSDEGIADFEKMIKEKREHFISYDEYLKVDAEKRGIIGNIKEYCMALAKHFLVSRKASEGTVIHSNKGELV